MCAKTIKTRNSKRKNSKLKLSDVMRIAYQHKLTTTSKATARKYKSHLIELVHYFDDEYISNLDKQDAYDFIDYLKNDKRQYRGLRGRENTNKVGLKTSSINGYIVDI